MSMDVEADMAIPEPHLDECWWVIDHGWPCICDLLRAVEERVEESLDRVWTHALRIKQAEAYANGVQAARDAVAALPVVSRGIGMMDDALAAIDALRGEQK